MAYETVWDPRRPLQWEWMLPAGAPDRRRRPDLGRMVCLQAGRALVGVGATLLLFAIFQLWGTGILESYAQRSLTRQLEQSAVAPRPDVDHPGRPVTERHGAGAAAGIGTAMAANAATFTESNLSATAPTPSASDPVPALSAPMAPLVEGDAVARLELPTIGMSKTVVEGVRRETLRTGPGHYPSSAVPGTRGNVAIAGHRTTHGAPFADLDRLAPGDEIHLDTAAGRFTYRVVGQPGDEGGLIGHRIVDPSAVEVIADHGDDRLTLTACHPKFSARQRIVVAALLVDGPPPAPIEPITSDEPRESTMDASSVPFPTTTSDPSSIPGTDRLPLNGEPLVSEGADDAGIGDSLGWQPSAAEPTLMWAVVASLTAFLAWVIGRFWPTRLVYPAAGPVLAVPLFLCFYHLERLLPAY